MDNGLNRMIQDAMSRAYQDAADRIEKEADTISLQFGALHPIVCKLRELADEIRHS